MIRPPGYAVTGLSSRKIDAAFGGFPHDRGLVLEIERGERCLHLNHCRRVRYQSGTRG
jgi:hypothetical protein